MVFKYLFWLPDHGAAFSRNTCFIYLTLLCVFVRQNIILFNYYNLVHSFMTEQHWCGVEKNGTEDLETTLEVWEFGESARHRQHRPVRWEDVERGRLVAQVVHFPDRNGHAALGYHLLVLDGGALEGLSHVDVLQGNWQRTERKRKQMIEWPTGKKWKKDTQTDWATSSKNAEKHKTDSTSVMTNDLLRLLPSGLQPLTHLPPRWSPAVWPWRPAGQCGPGESWHAGRRCWPHWRARQKCPPHVYLHRDGKEEGRGGGGGYVKSLSGGRVNLHRGWRQSVNTLVMWHNVKRES